MRTRLLLVLLVVAAGARLLLAMAAMPPYAGLDEAWHVARVAFVRLEHRQPSIAEKSMPPYITSSMRGDTGAMPALGEMGARWPEIVRSQPILPHRQFRPEDLRPFTMPNYEAQQPPLYYAIASHLGGSDALTELQRLRLLALPFALILVCATASIGMRHFGTAAILAAALIPSMPTWITLVVRASNDAVACALLAVAIAITASSPRKLAPIALEAIAWALAVATKLYVWPVAIVFPLLWRMQRGSRFRLVAVSVAGAISAAATMTYLATHTRNPVGVFGFDAAAGHGAPKSIELGTMIKTTLASAIWTSGQYNDALTLRAMLLYAVPLLIAFAIVTSSLWRGKRPLATITLYSLVAFGAAQVVVALGFIRQARAAGISLPLGGKEGWYWYALVPIVFAIVVAPAVSRWRWLAVWIVAWDIVITEGALFHDFAGVTTPLHPSLLFRWGPFGWPFTAHLDGIGCGPLASHLVLLRVVHLAALASLFTVESFFARELRHE